jgi:hypothetical protein
LGNVAAFPASVFNAILHDLPSFLLKLSAFGIPYSASIISVTGTFNAFAIFPIVLGDGLRLPEKYLLIEILEIPAESAKSLLFMQALAIAICNF